MVQSSDTLWLLRDSFVTTVSDYPTVLRKYLAKSAPARRVLNHLADQAMKRALLPGRDLNTKRKPIDETSARILRQSEIALHRLQASHLACVTFASFLLESYVNELGMRHFGPDAYFKEYERFSPAKKWKEVPQVVYRKPLEPPTIVESLNVLFGWRNRLAHDKDHTHLADLEQAIAIMIKGDLLSDQQKPTVFDLPVTRIVQTILDVERALKQMADPEEIELLSDNDRGQIALATRRTSALLRNQRVVRDRD